MKSAAYWVHQVRGDLQITYMYGTPLTSQLAPCIWYAGSVSRCDLWSVHISATLEKPSAGSQDGDSKAVARVVINNIGLFLILATVSCDRLYDCLRQYRPRRIGPSWQNSVSR